MNSLYAPYARTIAWRALPWTVLATRYFFRYSRWRRSSAGLGLALGLEGKEGKRLEGGRCCGRRHRRERVREVDLNQPSLTSQRLPDPPHTFNCHTSFSLSALRLDTPHAVGQQQSPATQRFATQVQRLHRLHVPVVPCGTELNFHRYPLNHLGYPPWLHSSSACCLRSSQPLQSSRKASELLYRNATAKSSPRSPSHPTRTGMALTASGRPSL